MNPDSYQALAVATGLKFYRLHNMRINRDYTPARMMATASRITGRKFAARDYEGAENALRDWVRARTTKGA